MRTVLLVATVFASALLSASPASASTRPSQPMSDPSERALDPAVSVGPNGHAAVAWTRRISPYERHGFVRRRDPSGVWGPLKKVSTPMKDPWGQHSDAEGADSPSVAVDSNGNTLVTWKSSIFYAPYSWPGAILAAYAPAGKPFGAQQVIAIDHAGSGPMYPKTSFTPAGEAVTVWQSVDNRIHSTVMKPGGKFVPDETVVEAVPGVSANPPIVRTGRDGTVLVAWSDRTEPPHGYTDRLQVAVRRPGQSFAPAQVIRSAPDSSLTAVSGVAKDGSALISIYDFGWQTRETRHDIAALPAGSTRFSPPVRVAGPDAALMPLPAASTMPLSIAFDDANTGYFFGQGENGVWAQSATTSGQLGKRSPIAPGAFGSDGIHNNQWDFDATYDAGGNLYVGWRGIETYGDTDTEASFYAYTVAKPKGQPFAPLVTHQHSSALITPPRLAAGATGDVIAAWIHGWNGMGELLLSESGNAAEPGSTTPTPPVGQTDPTTPTEPASPTTPTTPNTPNTPATPNTPNAPNNDAVAPSTPVGASGSGPVPDGAPEVPLPSRNGDSTDPAPVSFPAAPQVAKTPAPAARAWCRIPDVRGMALARAKRALTAAGCRTGKVTRGRGKRAGKVIRQNSPGAVREHRFRVALVVSR